MMHKFTLFFLMSLSLLFSACFKPKNLSLEGDVIGPTYIKDRCINDQFAQGQETRLYGIKCIEGKRLLIRTNNDGSRVTTSRAQNNLKSEVSFVNEVYSPTYTLLKNKGDDSKDTSYLRDLFLGEKAKEFFGSRNTKYDIVFKTSGNYLILFKSSKKLEDIPYTERTSLQETGSGEYMVPFLGYPIEYCNAEAITNSNNEKTNQYRTNCDVDSTVAKYIRLKSSEAVAFDFKDKQDLIPADYFDGQWFVTYGAVESNTGESEIAPSIARLIEFTKYADFLEGTDASGDIQDRNRQKVISLPVQWVDYELNKNGQTFSKFGERQVPKKEFQKKTFALIQFEKGINTPLEMKQKDKHIDTSNMKDLLITDNYFSFLVITTGGTYPIKYRFSFLKKSSVDSEGFFQRKWSETEHNRFFGILPTIPQVEQKAGESAQEDILKHVRMILFNVGKKDNTIKWFFSKNTPKDDNYRDIAREAVKIWNQAFKIITKGSGKSIKIELVEGEDKDLGDLRYNIINLILAKDILTSYLVGYAPSYINSNTGQIIATTSNVLMHVAENAIIYDIQSYIRDQVFQKKQGHNMSDKDFEVISPRMKFQIEASCGDKVENFIKKKREARLRGELKPYHALKDRDLTVTCGKKIARNWILATLLHEMGHSFGLGHNFKASADKDNYYKNQNEVKKYFPEIAFGTDFHLNEIPKTSSTMDYIPPDQPQLTYLGKYDLAALRFLYRYQVEDLKGGFIDLGPDHPLPEEQTTMSEQTLANRKKYLHCSDAVLNTEILCEVFDYGSTPKEITENYIKTFNKFFNSVRYRYDKIYLNQPIPFKIQKILLFYKRWINLRNSSFQSQVSKTKYRLSQGEKSQKEYEQILQNELEGRNENSEYILFSKVRDIIPQFFQEFLLKNSMRCHVVDNKEETHVINFELIRDQLHFDAEAESQKANFFAENCYSKDVINFLNKNGLNLVKQSGVENFATLLYSRFAFNGSSNLTPLFLWQLAIGKQGIFQLVVEEPDKAHKLRQEIEKKLFNPPEGHTFADFMILQKYYAKFTARLVQSQLGDKFRSAREENLKYSYFSKLQTTGTGANSFYQLITKPLKNGVDIRTINGPFLTQAHESFKKAQLKGDFNGSFQDYLLKKKTSEIFVTEHFLSIPWQNDNFPAKIFKKYNENNEKIVIYKEQGELSFLDRTTLQNLEWHNQILSSLL